MNNIDTLKNGYKMTKLGWIPEDWEVDSISNHTAIKTGNSDTQDREDDGLYPFFVRSNTIERINKYSFDGEAVLTSGDGVGVGKIYHYIDGKFDYHQRVYNIHGFDSSLDGKFFYYFFSNHFYRRVMSMTAKGSVDSVRMEMIAKMLIPLPPLPEQQKIATILSTWDKAINNLEPLISEKETLKKGLMQVLLTGKKRFPGYTDEWKEVKLGDVLKIGSGKDYKHLNKGIIPVYGTGGFMTMVDDFLFDGESVGIGRKGTIDKPVYLNGKFWTVDTLFYTHSFKGCTPNYVYFLFLTINWKLYNEASGVPSLSKTTIEKIKVVMPSIPEQQKISSLLSAAIKEIETLKKELNSFKEQKRGLMQKLLTGDVRVKI